MKKLFLLACGLLLSAYTFAQYNNDVDAAALRQAMEHQKAMEGYNELMSFLGWIVVVIIFYFLLKRLLSHLFEAKYSIRLKEAQLVLTAKMAITQGIPEDEVKKLVNDAMYTKGTLRDTASKKQFL